MAQAESVPAVRPRRRFHQHAATIALEGLALAFLLAAGAGVAVFRSREDVAQTFAEDWLRSHGVEGEIKVDRIDASGFSGRVRLGPAKNPDLVADRVDVDYAFAPPWAGGKTSVTPRSIRLVRPRAKLVFDGKTLHFGSLDKLITELTSGPKSNTPLPDLRIDDGSLVLATPYGLVRADQIQAMVAQGRLGNLDVRLGPAELKFGAAQASVSGAVLHLTAANSEALRGTVSLKLAKGQAGTFSLDDAQANLTVVDLRFARRDQRLSVSTIGHLTATAAKGAAGPERLNGLSLTLDVPAFGASSGPALEGRFAASGQLSAQSLSGQVSAKAVKVAAATKSAAFSQGPGGLRLKAPVTATAAVQSLPLAMNGSTLMLTQAKASLNGSIDTGAATIATGAADLDASGGFSAKDAGRFAAATPVLGQEPQYSQALSAGLRQLHLAAPGIAFSLGKSLSLQPGKPVELTTASGVHAVLTPASLSLGPAITGDLAVNLEGGGLPPARLQLRGLSWKSGQLDSEATLATTLDFGPAKAAVISLDGRVRYGPGGFSLTSTHCATLSADHLELGDNRVEHPAGEACPVDGSPLIVANQGGWRLAGRLTKGKAEIPFLQLRTVAAAAQFSVTGAGSQVSADIDLTEVPILDTTQPTRFERLSAKGPLRLAGDVWRGTLQIATATHGPLGQVSLVHNQSSGAGSVEIDASHLVFAKGGLQPVDISALAALLVDAQGPVSFTGRMDWTHAQAPAGTGRLVINALSFVSPLGPVQGLRADVALTSLAPLITAPHQSATVALVDAFAPMKDGQITFGLTEDALTIESAQLSVVGGRGTLAQTVVPLAQTGTVTGTIGLDKIDLGQVIALTSFADKIKADLIIDGTLPFEVDAKSFRLLKGQIATDKPGRLAISRELLSGVEAGEAKAEISAAGAPAIVAEAPAFNIAQDLAYQAMENLAVDSLKATIQSLPNGRLAAAFSIQGHHDPAKNEPLTRSLSELIKGEAFSRHIPLPKGTPIDLTLDTSLNFDEVMRGVKSSFGSFRQQHAPRVQVRFSGKET